MRQLTASQKIAILENRVAHLEKQAMFAFIQDKLESLVSGLRPLKVASKAIKKSGLKPRDLERGLDTAPKTKEYKQLLKGLQGKSDEQKIYILADMIESGEGQSEKVAHLSKYSRPFSIRGYLVYLGVALVTVITIFLDRQIRKWLKKIDLSLKDMKSNKKYLYKFLRAVIMVLYYPIKGIRALGSIIVNINSFFSRKILERGTGLKIPNIDPFGK